MHQPCMRARENKIIKEIDQTPMVACVLLCVYQGQVFPVRFFWVLTGITKGIWYNTDSPTKLLNHYKMSSFPPARLPKCSESIRYFRGIWQSFCTLILRPENQKSSVKRWQIDIRILTWFWEVILWNELGAKSWKSSFSWFWEAILRHKKVVYIRELLENHLSPRITSRKALKNRRISQNLALLVNPHYRCNPL